MATGSTTPNETFRPRFRLPKPDSGSESGALPAALPITRFRAPHTRLRFLGFDPIYCYGAPESRNSRKSDMTEINSEGQDTASERAEIHFLAALVDELMRKLMVAGVLSQAQLNGIEQAVAERTGVAPRGW